jgi:hypothetical protein
VIRAGADRGDGDQIKAQVMGFYFARCSEVHTAIIDAHAQDAKCRKTPGGEQAF